MKLTSQTRDALTDLLSRPDPPEMPRRRLKVLQVGLEDRYQSVFLPLLTRWAQRRIVEATDL